MGAMEASPPVSVGDVVLSGVGVRFDAAWAVDGISLTLRRGCVTALLGASGSGKSTLLRAIAGLERIARGEIRMGPQVLANANTHLPPEARRVGVVFQDYALFPHMTAAQNVAFGLDARPRLQRQALAGDWLARVGLGDRRDAFPHELSGGEQQRVALARALAPEPAIVLLDEPFSALDPGLRSELRDLAGDVLRAAGCPALFVTHDADEALYMADQLAILSRGRLVQGGSPHEVYAHPADLTAAAALGSVNVHRGRVQGGVLTTPFVALPAPDLADGAPAVAVVRVEGVRPIPGTAFGVRDRRAQGPFTLLRVEAPCGALWKAQARADVVSDAGAGVSGGRCDLSIAPGAAHVFADLTA